MPYIKENRRGNYPETSGELNYNISILIHHYIMTKGLSYQTINEVIGVLECAKLEHYRMIAAPYEDSCIRP